MRAKDMIHETLSDRGHSHEDSINDLPTNEQILRDAEEMIKSFKTNKYPRPYGITMIDENGDLIDFLIDEDGNVMYDHSDSE